MRFSHSRRPRCPRGQRRCEPAVLVGHFSSGSLDGWQKERFLGATRYELVEEDGPTVLRARRVSGSRLRALYRRVRVDLTQTPILHWSWKIARPPDNGPDETTKAGDDYAARVYVVFSGGFFFWRTHAIDYVWAAHRPVGSVWPNAYTANARMIALRSGPVEARGSGCTSGATCVPTTGDCSDGTCATRMRPPP